MSSFPVLLVEDNDSLREMLRHALDAQGHAVVEARDHAEAIQQLRQSRPAVVLTDLRLPDGDGLAVLRAARELDPVDLSGTMSEAIRRVTGEVERRKVEAALKEAVGHKGRAAEQLQLTYKSFTQKMREHGIPGA